MIQREMEAMLQAIIRGSQTWITPGAYLSGRFVPQHLLRGAAIVLAAFQFCSLATAQMTEESSRLAGYYGFGPLEVMKLEDRSKFLHSGDLNHDGLIDLLAVDNSHNRIDLLLQRKETTPHAVASREVNKVQQSSLFEHVKLPVDHEILSLTTGDFDKDGRTDIAYLGTPDQLVILYQPEKGTWNRKFEQRVADMSTASWSLAAGDLNQDDRTDLVVLGERETSLFLQLASGQMAPVQKLLNTSEKMGLVQISDLNGDGLADLVYLAGEGNNRKLGVRFGRGNKTLGAEFLFDLDRPRSVTLANIDAQPGNEIVTIDSRNGRIRLSKIEMEARKAGELPDRLVQFGFGPGGTAKDRSVAIGDVDQDGLTDILVSDGAASRVLLFRQDPRFGLDLGTGWPSLKGADQIRLANIDGVPGLEMIVQSVAEKSLGVTSFRDDRIPFPELISIDTEPVAIEMADLDGDGQVELLFLEASKSGRDYSSKLRALTHNGTKFVPFKFGDQESYTVPLKGRAEGMLAGDLTGNNRSELLVFQGAGKSPVVLSFGDQGVVSEINSTGPLGPGMAGAMGTSIAEFGNAKGLLISQDNLVRFVTYDQAKGWQIVMQYTAPESNARLMGGTTIELDGQPGPEVVLYDGGLSKLRVYRQAPEGLVAWKEIDMGDFPFLQFKTGDFNGDHQQDLLVLGTDRMAVLYSGGVSPKIAELGQFEMTQEKTYPADLVAGDFNDDGWTDLAIIDTRSQYLQLVQYRPSTGLEAALSFRVFEQKSFDDDEGGSGEPREGIAADVTGDGRTDLILLAKDRVLIYPQDTVESPEPARTTQKTSASPSSTGAQAQPAKAR